MIPEPVQSLTRAAIRVSSEDDPDLHPNGRHSAYACTDPSSIRLPPLDRPHDTR